MTPDQTVNELAAALHDAKDRINEAQRTGAPNLEALQLQFKQVGQALNQAVVAASTVPKFQPTQPAALQGDLADAERALKNAAAEGDANAMAHWARVLKDGLDARGEPPTFNPGPRRPTDTLGRVADVLRPVNTGQTFGAGPMITSGIAAGVETATDALGLTEDQGTGIREKYAGYLGDEDMRAERFADANPNLNTGLEVGGAVSSAFTPGLKRLAMLGTSATQPMALQNVAKAAGGGALVGSIYGANTSRGEGNLLPDTITGGLSGAAGGAAGNVIQGALGSILRRSQESAFNKATSARLGIAPATFAAMRQGLEEAEADIPGGVRAYLQQGGGDAMLGDALPSHLDYAGNVGTGAPIVKRALQERTGRASENVRGAINTMFGPEAGGMNAAARDIAESTRAERSAAYRQVHNTALDYGDGGSGAEIVDALQYVPRRSLIAAKQQVDDDLVAEFGPDAHLYKQWEIKVGDDGSVVTSQMPSAREVDYLKRALDTLAEEKDQFGRPAPGTQSITKARDRVREALKRATIDPLSGVSAYQTALDLGGDKIAMDRALELGRALLRPGTPLETVTDGLANAGPAEKQRVAEGIRIYLGHVLGNVKRIRSDPNLDQRQAWAAFAELTTENAQKKLAALYPPDELAYLTRTLNEAERSFLVKANAHANSKTAGRTEFGARFEQGVTGQEIPTQFNAPSLSKMPALAFNYFTGRTGPVAVSKVEAAQREMAGELTGEMGDRALRRLQTYFLPRPPESQPSVLRNQLLARVVRLAAPPTDPVAGFINSREPELR